MKTTFESPIARPLDLLLNRGHFNISCPESGSIFPKNPIIPACEITPFAVPSNSRQIRNTAAFKCVLVPTDFSSSSSRALECAYRLAENIDGELIVLYVALPLKASHSIATSDTERRREVLHAHAEELLKAQLHETIGETAGKSIRVMVAEGYAHQTIVREALAESADILVIARHGHSKNAGELMGPTAEYVVRNAPCPVMLVGD